MRVTKAQQEKNRQRVVTTAARLLRQRGIEGVGVDALAKAAGLTHGAVYSHFDGKDDLAAAAVTHALAQSYGAWQADANKVGLPGSAAHFNRLVRAYVSRAHRDQPGQGCAVAAMAPDATRHGKKVRRAFSAHIEAMIDYFGAGSPGATDEARREQAIATISTMVGAIVLSRAVEDRALSDRILLTARRKLIKAE